VIIPFQFDQASAFNKTGAIVKKGEEWFYINRQGKKITANEANPETETLNTRKEMPPIRPNN
jgi:WG containing repeat